MLRVSLTWDRAGRHLAVSSRTAKDMMLDVLGDVLVLFKLSTSQIPLPAILPDILLDHLFLTLLDDAIADAEAFPATVATCAKDEDGGIIFPADDAFHWSGWQRAECGKVFERAIVGDGFVAHLEVNAGEGVSVAEDPG